jgi:hypothetical protein
LDLGFLLGFPNDFSMIHGWSALGGLTMAEWEDELEQWLKPFLDRLGHKTRQRMCPLYVAGPIGPSEQAHQQLKEELGLYHFEGRSWQGLHRHSFDDYDCLRLPATPSPRTRGAEKKNQRASASTNHARLTSRHRRSHPSGPS